MKIFSIPMAFFVSFFSHSTQACTMPIIKITITDETADVNVIQVIDDQLRLSKIQAAWCRFEEIDFPPNADWTHGLKIEGGDMEGIWLYNQKGYLSRLNYQVKPSFHITNLEEFNLLIGL